MMLSSVIRFPLIFISGIFVPIGQLSPAGRVLSYFSPITYLVDIFNYSLKGSHNLNLFLDFGALIGFAVAFLFLANFFHRRNLLKGL
ncbi:MAG: ABC transporter permease [Actinomycetota bacterium]|nr:ABC transporter permease [Actinomycetota bacterium]